MALRNTHCALLFEGLPVKNEHPYCERDARGLKK